MSFRTFVVIIFSLVLSFLVSSTTMAQGMPAPYQSTTFGAGMGNWNYATSTNASLGEEGEQWMEIMMGDRHEAIEEAIRNSVGEEGLRAMHERMGVMMGNPNISGQSLGYGRWGAMPMMQGMMGNWGGGSWGGWPMFGGSWGLGFFGWIFGLFLLVTLLLYPVILVLGIRALWLWLKKHHS